VINAVDELLRLDDRQQIAVVTHAGVMRLILRTVFGLEEQEAWNRTKPYCCSFQYVREVSR
jgi:alpha-ribazole phosphatase/probable phosphoglycerate mutase